MRGGRGRGAGAVRTAVRLPGRRPGRRRLRRRLQRRRWPPSSPTPAARLVGLGHGLAGRTPRSPSPAGGAGRDPGHRRRGDPAAARRRLAGPRRAAGGAPTPRPISGLAVLVHPMQLPRPEWSEPLPGQPDRQPHRDGDRGRARRCSAASIEELPLLRICFVHGGGCAPGLLGRWEHGWHARADVRRRGRNGRRARAFGELYFDTVTHDARRAGPARRPGRRRTGSSAAATTRSTWPSPTRSASPSSTAPTPRR